ncbi:MAG: hypothetical protein ACKV19_05150 [Verrucomicrobiales bacterium]
MSNESYTFACPVCAVRLSVPKALAGVRGPCPQCHHEITAPEPEAATAATVAGTMVPEAVVSRNDLPAPVPSVVVPIALGRPPSADELAQAVEPEIVAREKTGAAESDEEGEDDETTTEAPLAATQPVSARDRTGRRSIFARLAAVLVIAGLIGLAVFNWLPRGSLRSALSRWVPMGLVDPVNKSAPGGPPSPSVSPPSTLRDVNEGGAAPTAAETTTAQAVPTPQPEAIEIRPAKTVDDPAAPTTSPTAAEEAVGEASSAPKETAAPEAEASATAEAAEAPAPEAPAPDGPAGPKSTAAETAGGIPRLVPTGDAPSLLPDISAVGSEATTDPLDESIAGAHEALTLFLQARTWRERIVLSEGGEALRKEMEEYYSRNKDVPNTPTSVEHIRSAPLPDGKGLVQIFHVTFADLPQGFPVPVFQTEDGWRIDWHAFAEFREERLRKFFSEYRDAPATLRVKLQRAKYQDRSVPNLDKKYVFRVSAPIDDHEGYVFVDQSDSIVGPKIADKLDWDAPPWLVMAKFKWVRGTAGRGHVELRDIVAETWRAKP